MYRKFCTVLFVTIFCNGVTYSSITKRNVAELISKGKQVVSTDAISQTNYDVELSTAAPDNGAHHIETPAVKTPSNSSEADGKSIPKDSPAVVKSINQGSEIKKDTQNAAAAIIKNSNATLNSSTDTTSNRTAHTIDAVPVTKNSTVTDLPPTNFSDMSRPIAAGENKTPVTTPAAGTTTKAPVTKPAVATPTPTPAAVSTSTDNVLMEHNSSSKTQENRFDGASFVGGIVLTIGLTAIGFIAFKYYKSGKIDANYRTL